MATEIVGTYNMSFASDYDDVPNFASEYSFLLYQDKPHTFWNNALDKLKSFIKTHKPIAVGLQEININDDIEEKEADSASGRNKKKGSQGSSAIRHMLENVNKTYETNYVIYTRNVSAMLFGSLTEPGVSIIIDTKRVGDVGENHKFDDSFNNETDTNIKTVDNQGKGRPLMMLLTDKNYLFVCMHGDQTPGLGKNKNDFDTDMITKNKLFLETQVNTFLEEKKVQPQSIYIMGDLNDRYDAISEFKIGDKIVKYEGESPYSCCHNWDSAAIEDRRHYFDVNDKKYGYGIDPKNEGVYTDNYKDKNNTEVKFYNKTKIPEQDVIVENYLYKGDKVFSSNRGTLEIFDAKLKEVSNASDHELVYFTSTSQSTGGKHSRTKKNKKRISKTKKNRKNRKGKKSRRSNK